MDKRTDRVSKSIDKKILIDALHSEELRVALVVDGKVEEYFTETSEKKILKGNIYLGKITHVEPSLQAAFVDYGGGSRHGFLGFNDVHPSYFRIPVSDREEDDSDDDSDRDFESADSDGSPVSEVGGEDVHADVQEKRRCRKSDPHRKYKIQEVLSPGQVVLVQVLKEERGTKGAALSTYLSLAGRFCVLIPNATRSGGISRRIEQVAERQRLRSTVLSLSVPDSMSVIVRTAGSGRSKLEIKSDYRYLLSLWEDIRTRTLEAKAPLLIYEDGDLVLRTIRDLYSSDISQIIISGESVYHSSCSIMKSMMSGHVRRVRLHSAASSVPLFREHDIEDQISAMYHPIVQLRSGGHIVLQQTEALVSIDVNSGRATKERDIEQTALRTNLEATEEIARQLRLRDLAGLVVIDLIDMEESRSNQEVERYMRELLNRDRARIRVGRISHFGLLELSRQRLNPNLIEFRSLPCGFCGGTGYVPSRSIALLDLLREIESWFSQSKAESKSDGLLLRVSPDLGLSLLNEKRSILSEIEQRYTSKVRVELDSLIKFGEHVLRSDRKESKESSPSRASQKGFRGKRSEGEGRDREGREREGRDREGREGREGREREGREGREDSSRDGLRRSEKSKRSSAPRRPRRDSVVSESSSVTEHSLPSDGNGEVHQDRPDSFRKDQQHPDDSDPREVFGG